MSLKFVRELFVMTMKKYAKLEEEMTCRFKIETRAMMNLNLSTQKSQNLHCNGLPLSKVYNV